MFGLTASTRTRFLGGAGRSNKREPGLRALEPFERSEYSLVRCPSPFRAPGRTVFGTYYGVDLQDGQTALGVAD